MTKDRYQWYLIHSSKQHGVFFLSKESLFNDFVEIRTSEKRRIFNLVQCYSSLGKNVCNAFLLSHFFNGADSTNSFSKVSKIWLSIWMRFSSFHELFWVFVRIWRTIIPDSFYGTIASQKELKLGFPQAKLLVSFRKCHLKVINDWKYAIKPNSQENCDTYSDTCDTGIGWCYKGTKGRPLSNTF